MSGFARYDDWKAHNPADEWLGPEPYDEVMEEKPCDPEHMSGECMTCGAKLGEWCGLGFGRNE